MGKSLVLLHRHNEALVTVKKGLQSMSTYHLIPLTWPGTDEAIQECHPQDVEVGNESRMNRRRGKERWWQERESSGSKVRVLTKGGGRVEGGWVVAPSFDVGF